MEKLSNFISRDEAKLASDCYESGWRAFLLVLAVVVVGNLVSALLAFAQWFRAGSSVELCVAVFETAAVLFLSGRFRMAFAGRILMPLTALLNFDVTPSVACLAYWEETSWSTLAGIGLLFLWGWGMDHGAGFVFEEKWTRRARRYVLLIPTVCLWPGLAYLAEQFEPQPLHWYWYSLVLLPVLLWPWVARHVRAADGQGPRDALFVAEIASRRAWKRFCYRGLACALLVLPVVGMLSILGEDERCQWPQNDPGILWTDARTKEEAWFWEDRGRYFRISDLDANLIHQLPQSVLETPASTNDNMQAAEKYAAESTEGAPFVLMKRIVRNRFTRFRSEHPDFPEEGTEAYEQRIGEVVAACQSFVLSDFATNVCAQIDAVRTNANDRASYDALCGLLSRYRVSSSNSTEFARNLGMHSVCVFCESMPRRMQFDSATRWVCAAGLSIGISAWTRETARKRHERTVRSKVCLPGIFVLTALALLILYRRGADSSAGFWIGLALFVNANQLSNICAGFSGDLPLYLQHAIWQGAFTNPLNAVLATLMSLPGSLASVALVCAWLAQSVLFVSLCWPTMQSAGKWRRRWAFTGKSALLLIVVCSAGAWGLPCLKSFLLLRLLVVLVLGAWGWSLRRKRRQYTEIPRLGLPFFLGWLVAEAAIVTPMLWVAGPLVEDLALDEALVGMLRTSIPVPVFGGGVELGAVLCLTLPVLMLACWGWLFLRQKFLNVLSLGGVMLIVGVFALPISLRLLLANITAGKAGAYDNVFFSKSGMQVVSAILLVAVMPAVMRFLRKTCRRFLTRDVYRMEQDVASAIERVFDETSNRVDSVYNVLSCMKIGSFAFYERVSRDVFVRIVSKDWTEQAPVTLTLGEQLRGCLGQSRELVDFGQLPYQPEMFFVSFELWRLHLSTKAALMLPICLGTSVRGLLFVGPDTAADMPTDRGLMTSINLFGLSSVAPR